MDTDTIFINTIRCLSADGVQKANSGHPGLPMGAAAMAYALWKRHLKFNPKNPDWLNRDRFILSAGHGSMLLYSLLHLTGYSLSLEDLKSFRQWGSKTPGHPENTLTEGVEMATGPLGQGVATAVGMAIAEKHLSEVFNKSDIELIDHYTYVLCSDGDLMEGVAQEACSIAGNLGLGKLILLYDDNSITIDGKTDLSFREDTEKKFESLGWHVVPNIDGQDMEAVDRSIIDAKKVCDKPSLLMCKTTIGYGSPNKAGSSKVHGSPLGEDELAATKEALGMPKDKFFYVPQEVALLRDRFISEGGRVEDDWNRVVNNYREKYPDNFKEFESYFDNKVDIDWSKALPVFTESLATRACSKEVIASLSKYCKNLVGGSADLAASVLTTIPDTVPFQKDSPLGRILCFGVREHGMAAIVNGITLHKGLKAFSGTFLVFSDYCRPSIRLAALMECPSIFLFSHDSIGLGEDGPTHQPIEHLTSLRVIPNLLVMRPCDGNETSACWKLALEQDKSPSVLVLSRQNLPVLSSDDVVNHPASRGGYLLEEYGAKNDREVTIVGTGSEVSLSVAAAKLLGDAGYYVRVVSMPCLEVFLQQDAEYQRGVIPSRESTVVVECGSTVGWYKYAQHVYGIDTFGASAPADILMENYGFTAEKLVQFVKSVV